MQRSALKTQARDNGQALLIALERLLSFRQNQDSTDPKIHAAIRHAQTLADRVRTAPKGRKASGRNRVRIPVDAGHQFRSMSGQHSGPCRATVPVDAGRGV